MKKIITIGLFSITCVLRCMDTAKKITSEPPRPYFRSINPEVEKRHNVAKWQSDLAYAVALNHQNELPRLLVQAGKDATELICSANSAYGPILRITYVENTPDIRKLLMKYMDEGYRKKCFDEEIAKLRAAWQFNVSQRDFKKTCPAAENLVRDFHQQDPFKYPLMMQEREKLGITKNTMLTQ